MKREKNKKKINKHKKFLCIFVFFSLSKPQEVAQWDCHSRNCNSTRTLARPQPWVEAAWSLQLAVALLLLMRLVQRQRVQWRQGALRVEKVLRRWGVFGLVLVVVVVVVVVEGALEGVASLAFVVVVVVVVEVLVASGFVVLPLLLEP